MWLPAKALESQASKSARQSIALGRDKCVPTLAYSEPTPEEVDAMVKVFDASVKKAMDEQLKDYFSIDPYSVRRHQKKAKKAK